MFRNALWLTLKYNFYSNKKKLHQNKQKDGNF